MESDQGWVPISRSRMQLTEDNTIIFKFKIIQTMQIKGLLTDWLTD
jgi:hypothetical protein